MRRSVFAALAALTLLPLGAANGVRATNAVDTAVNFQLVGHNPLNMRGMNAALAIYSGGFRAINLANPSAPTEAGVFIPDPLPVVVTEDQALSMGRNKVVMWSYPIIKDGLIYLIDLRNGLYILRYTGPGSAFVDQIKFLEGNSNLGDAVCRKTSRRTSIPC